MQEVRCSSTLRPIGLADRNPLNAKKQKSLQPERRKLEEGVSSEGSRQQEALLQQSAAGIERHDQHNKKPAAIRRRNKAIDCT